MTAAKLTNGAAALTPSGYLLKSSREYAIYASQKRAIPSITDGLKPVQRIALWLLRNRAEKIKTVALSGLMAYERLYVHGETSANDAIGLLAAPYMNNNCLIEGEGQFGSRTKPGAEGIGAPRYTEVKRAKVAEAILYHDLDLVPLEDNYDGSNKQPVHFLPLIPLVLLNGIKGVGVGYSTAILPHSLKTLVQATQDALEGREIKPLVPSFDNLDITVKALPTGQWEFSGKVTIEDTSTVRVTELPPGLDIEDFRKFLYDLEDDKDSEVQGFTDLSAEKIDIVIRFSRGSLAARPARKEIVEDNGKKFPVHIPARPAMTVDKMLDLLKLREKRTEQIVAVKWDDSGIKQWDSPEQVVREFAEWRLGWYKTRYEKLIADTSDELVYWKLLKALFDNGFTKRLGTFADRAAVEADVLACAAKAKLSVTERHVERAINLATYRWTKEFAAEVEAKIKELEAALKDFQATLKSPAKLKAVYLGELEELKKLRL